MGKCALHAALAGMAPIGSFLAGAMAHHLGAPLTIALGGVGCIAGSLPFWLHLPNYRGEIRQLIIAQGMVASIPAQENAVVAEAVVASD